MIQYRRLRKQKVFEMKWKRDTFSEEVRVELKAKSGEGGSFTGARNSRQS